MNQTQLRHAGVKESLLRPLGEKLTRHVVEAGQFRLAGHDPITPLEQLEQPLLGVFAEHDQSAPPGESIELFRQALHRGGNTDHTLRVISGVDHVMLANRDGFDVNLAQRANLDPEYVETVTEWVHDIANGSRGSDADADASPPQAHQSAPLAPMTAFESLPVQLAGLGVLALAFGSYPITAAIRRLRGQRDPVPARWLTRMLAAAGLVVPPLTLGYLGYIMITAGQGAGPVVAGRPLVWLVLQLGALSAAAATVALIARWRRERFTPATTARCAVLVAGAAVFLSWATYWGLFTL
jgi:hypothetical protein